MAGNDICLSESSRVYKGLLGYHVDIHYMSIINAAVQKKKNVRQTT